MPVASSIDPHEVSHYQRLADTWWDVGGPFWPLHRLNGLRVQYLARTLAQHFGLDAQSATPLAGLKILDIGCGGGILSEAMARLGAHVHGIDVVEKNVSIASLHARSEGLDIRYEPLTAEELAVSGTTYDAVLNMEVVEHVADLEGFMRAGARLVRPGGLMTVATINRTLRSFLFAIVGAEYVLGWLPRGTHRWDRFPKPAELEDLLAASDLRVIDRTGVRVNPVTRKFTLTPSVGVNYMLVAARDLVESSTGAEDDRRDVGV